MSSTKKKSKSSGTERLAELETANERRKWHISRLELIMRSLENGSLEIDDVLSIKETVQYYVESNTVRPRLLSSVEDLTIH